MGVGVWVWVCGCGCVGLGLGVWVWVCGCGCVCVGVGLGVWVWVWVLCVRVRAHRHTIAFPHLHVTNMQYSTVIVIVVIMELKGAIRDVLLFPHCAANWTRSLKWPGRKYVQITCNTQSAHHVQHVVCHLVRRDSSARISFSFVLLAETINRRRMGRKPLTTSFRKCNILKPEHSSPNRDSKQHNSIGGRLGKQTC